MKELQTIIQAIEKAQQTGVYSLQDVQQILNAIGVVSQIVQAANAEPEPKEKNKK